MIAQRFQAHFLEWRLIQRGSRFSYYPCDQLFSKFFIGNAKNMDFENSILIGEKLLKFCRLNIFTTADHNILFGPDNAASTLRVYGGKIT